MSTRPLRIGLAASRLHRTNPDAALFRLLRPLRDAIMHELRPELLAVGQTYDAIEASGVLSGYAGLQRLPTRRDGGLIHLVAGVVAVDPARRLDAIVYLLDPDDVTSVFPEGQALKRECVIHEAAFVSTFAHAREWFELERVQAGFAPDAALDPWFDFTQQTIALIAHDARKDAMMSFVRRHYAYFDRFAGRVATGTTGSLLNGVAEGLRNEGSAAWVRPFQSGPLGGDAEIALEVLQNRCQRIVFFEDPHVARQHEADIQLLERSARIAGERTMCVSDIASANHWIEGCTARDAM
ncbi:MAG: methylglyoxal synthase [Casimicrobiaceae bacterium]